MITTLLLGCNLFNSTTDTGVKTTDTVADSTPTTETGFSDPIYFTKYKVEVASTLRGVYSSGNGVYIVGTRGQAWVGSATDPWAVVALPLEVAGADAYSLWGNGVDATLELAVAMEDGWVATYTGGVWTATSLGAGDNRGVGGTTLTNLFAVGENGIQHWDGTAWTLEAEPTVDMNAVYAYDGGALACGAEGNILKRGESGVWEATVTNKVANFYGVDGTGATDIWAVGDQGIILHWDGASWRQTTTDSYETLRAVYAFAPDAALAVGNNGAALSWDGTEWTVLNSDTHQNLYAVHGVSGVNAWVVGDGGLASQYKP